ncbi:MAG: hypothetical protein KIT62_07805 [Cyclobacteriaceae bacterium]|nr:hypothetical protein [Cyclobacteriaceae bacterium]
MALVTKVKAANITNLSDARYCAGMGVDWIGFPAAEVDAKLFREITGWLSGPQWVIELDKQPWPVLADYAAQVWQCSLNDFEEALRLPGAVMVQLEAYRWKEAEALLRTNSDRIEAIILSGFSGSDGKATALTIGQLFPVLVDMNENPHSLDEILSWSVSGIQLHGSSEERPGLKDYAQLADVLEQLEAE